MTLVNLKHFTVNLDQVQFFQWMDTTVVLHFSNSEEMELEGKDYIAMKEICKR